MNQKNFRRWKRLLLLAGFGVGGFTILAAGHQMVEALEASNTPGQLSSSLSLDRTGPTSLNPVNPNADIDAWLATLEQSSAPRSALATSAQPNSASSTRSTATEPASDSESLNSSATQSTRHLMAINTGTANDPQQPVSQVAPTEIATGQWYGASFPVEDFQSYTSPFGYRSSPDGGYSTEFHYGLDMAAPEGSYVRNWWTGKVVEVSDDSNCGTSVVVESGEWTHIYCHMQGHVEEDGKQRYMIDRDGGIQIVEGQEVAAGSRIGRVGMTGRTTGPHLHWGLKYDGSWVDPALVLRAMYSSQQQASASQ